MADILFGDGFFSGKKQSGRNPNRLLQFLIALLAAVLIGEIAFHVMLRPSLRIARVVVEGDPDIPDRELLRSAGIEGMPYFFDVDPAAVERRLEELPAVKSASAERHFPDAMSIRVEERTPLAVALVEEGGSTVPAVFDEHGVVFRWKQDAGNIDVPVVSGLKFENLELGVQLPRYMRAFLSDLRSLERKAPVLFEQISEYRVVPTGERDFDVLLYPVSYPVQVRIEPELSERTCKYILMVLDTFQREGSLDRIHELDFRAGEVVFRMKEE